MGTRSVLEMEMEDGGERKRKRKQVLEMERSRLGWKGSDGVKAGWR
jgi:hypothetical protein